MDNIFEVNHSVRLEARTLEEAVRTEGNFIPRSAIEYALRNDYVIYLRYGRFDRISLEMMLWLDGDKILSKTRWVPYVDGDCPRPVEVTREEIGRMYFLLEDEIQEYEIRTRGYGKLIARAQA
jgi:hypothetical protein